MATGEIRRTLLGLLQEKAPLPSGYLSQSNVTTATFDTLKAEIDVLDVSSQLAKFATSIDGAYHCWTIDGYQTRDYEPGDIKESFAVNAGDGQWQRAPGMNPFESPDMLAFAMRRIQTGVETQIDRVQRRQEQLLSELMQTGKVTLGSVQVSYQADATFFPTASVPWATTATATPLSDLQALCRVIEPKNKGIPVDRFILGRDAANSLIAWLQAKADSTGTSSIKVVLGDIDPSGGTVGFKYLGRVFIDGNWRSLYSYDAMYETALGTWTTYQGANRVVALCGNLQMKIFTGIVKRMFAPASQVAGLVPAVVKVERAKVLLNLWPSMAEDGTGVMIKTHARTIPAPLTVNAYGCLAVGA